MFSVLSENISNYLGYDSLVYDSKWEQNQTFVQPLSNLLTQQISQQKIKLDIQDNQIDEEMDPDSLEEKNHLLFYWRFDEGKGQQITDITSNELHSQFNSLEQWNANALENGNPIEYEDKWGKENQPSYEIDITENNKKSFQIQLNEQIIERVQLCNNFCLEFWIKFEDLVEFTIIKSKYIRIIMYKSYITIENYNKIYEIQFNQQLQQKEWIHLAFSNNRLEQQFKIFVNGKLDYILKNTLIKSHFNKTTNMRLFYYVDAKYLSITEVRFWAINLNQKIIKENYKQPLPMLYEQKKAIKIKIRKIQQQEEVKQEIPQLKKLGGLKKLGKP